jgi:hypothetical protein
MRTMQFDYTQTPYWERPLCTLLRAFIEDQIHITKQTLNLTQILIHILDQSEGWSGWRNSNLAMRSVAADGETPSPRAFKWQVYCRHLSQRHYLVQQRDCQKWEKHSDVIRKPISYKETTASCIHAHNYRKSIVNLAPALRNPQWVCWIHWEVAGTDMYQKTAEEKTRYERGKSRHSCSCQRP